MFNCRSKKNNGVDLTSEQIILSLKRMGIFAITDEKDIFITVPEYRDDFLHAVDVVEDVIIGYSLNNFEPEMHASFTMGRLTAAEELGRKAKRHYGWLGSFPRNDVQLFRFQKRIY